MATQSVTLSASSVTDLKSALSLTEGVSYTIQVVQGEGVVLYEAPAAPSSTATLGHVVTPEQPWRYSVSSEALYAWSSHETATVIVSPAA